ncbi:MAG: PSD1 and planctomycete cytochrome C domain-containing protein [Phycisphaeraceae bacterium]
MPRCLSALAGASLIALTCGSTSASASAAASPDYKFFEQKIRPVLVEHCYSCHSADAQANKKLKGGLLLDTREGSLRGGDSGRAVVPGEAGKSLLLKAMKYSDPDLQMPPKKKLPDSVVADFEKWIESGALDPRDGEAVTLVKAIDLEKAADHWAFQPLSKPAVPAVAAKYEAMVITPIDAFLLEQMTKAGVEPAAKADPRTLIRRVYLDLIGLPPSPEEVAAFEQSAIRDPQSAISDVVDRLLASPRYGERWGRHWLDVARYAETQGYERDENKPFAWRYRDWVIDAFNSDMHYLRFVQEQIAGDELADSTVASRIATGFLRVGTFDTIAADAKMARYDNLDDTLGVTMSAFLGMTIQCARCHDHKFEPLSQEDYFRLLSVFEPLPDPKKAVEVGGPAERAAYEKELAAWEATIAGDMASLDAIRAAALEGTSAAELEEKKIKIDAKRRDETLAAYRVPSAERDKKQKEITSLDGGRRFDDIIRAIGSDEQKKEVESLYRDLKRRMDKEKPQPMLALAAGEGNIAGDGTAKRLPPVPVPSAGETAKNWPSMKLMIRGEVHREGDVVRMGVPEILSVVSKQSLPALEPLEGSSGRRLWLATWMVQSQQPLLARTIVNRVWQNHFGRGFVANANELGVAGGEPSHPQLLEWLAADFVEHGWRLKHLHKRIVTSRLYQLAAEHPNVDVDIEAALYSRWKTRRLEAEAIRDSILAVSGRLNDKMHGPSIYPPFDGKVVGASAGEGWQKSDEEEASRRSVYIYVKRALALPEMEMLGSPDSSVSMPRRQVATTSVQALLLLNGRLVSEQAAHLAQRLQREAGSEPAAQVRRLWLLALSRQPGERELDAALAYLKQHPRAGQNKDGVDAAMIGLCQVVMNTNEFVYLN